MSLCRRLFSRTPLLTFNGTFSFFSSLYLYRPLPLHIISLLRQKCIALTYSSRERDYGASPLSLEKVLDVECREEQKRTAGQETGGARQKNCRIPAVRSPASSVFAWRVCPQTRRPAGTQMSQTFNIMLLLLNSVLCAFTPQGRRS